MTRSPHACDGAGSPAPFGLLADGRVVHAISMVAGDVAVRVITYGATLQSVIAPDRLGRRAEITLGHDDLEPYERLPGFLGVSVGRYANRIAGGRFRLDGVEHVIHRNDGPNALHGGVSGFDKALWTIASTRSGAEPSVVLRHVSPHGDQGFPGRVEATVTYTLSAPGRLRILFEATSDRPTVLNLTNHATFNLGGERSPHGIYQHLLMIGADYYTPVDAGLIPTGELRSVAGTPFDFRRPRELGDHMRDGRDEQIAHGRGYDHNFVLRDGRTAVPKLAARLEDPVGGRVLEVETTEPGLQLYTGNAFDGRLRGRGGRLYRMGDGVALEPQRFPDTPNQPAFGSARVDPGQPYRHEMVYAFSVR